MTPSTATRLALVLAMVSVGCGSPGTSPAPRARGPSSGPSVGPGIESQRNRDTRVGHTPVGAGDDTRARTVVEYAVAILRNLSRTVNAARGDCQVMGRALDRWLRVNGGQLDGQLRRAMTIPETQRAGLMRRALGDDRDVGRAMVALQTCEHHPSVAAAIARLQLG